MHYNSHVIFLLLKKVRIYSPNIASGKYKYVVLLIYKLSISSIIEWPKFSWSYFGQAERSLCTLQVTVNRLVRCMMERSIRGLPRVALLSIQKWLAEATAR